MANSRWGNPIDGIFLLDKPIGLSSNEALQQVKRIFRASKAGHTGSLDPLASGMLPICFGEATKFSQFLLEADKTYIVKAKLGIRTTTGDTEGEVVTERPVPALTAAQLEKVLATFRGDIMQVPSMYSALKHKGQPLYKLARQGIEISREARPVSIYELTLQDHNASELSLKVHCSKGTYIRTLVEDIGEALGTGAHVIALHRTSIGSYGPEEMLTLPGLIELAESKGPAALTSLLLPLSTSVMAWPDVNLAPSLAFYLRLGQPVLVPHAPTEGWVRLLTTAGEFLGVGEVLDDGRIAPRRLLAESKMKKAS